MCIYFTPYNRLRHHIKIWCSFVCHRLCSPTSVFSLFFTTNVFPSSLDSFSLYFCSSILRVWGMGSGYWPFPTPYHFFSAVLVQTGSRARPGARLSKWLTHSMRVCVCVSVGIIVTHFGFCRFIQKTISLKIWNFTSNVFGVSVFILNV